MSKTIASVTLETLTATELIAAIGKLLVLTEMPNRSVVYVFDSKGREIKRVKLESRTLSDGSEVYNLVLYS